MDPPLPPPVDCVGVVTGVWSVDELPDELLELLELPDELDDPELAAPLDDVLLLVDVPEDFTAACVDPGKITSTAPATPTLATDTAIVVDFRRRLPCSRSATARASSLLFMPTVLHAWLYDLFEKDLSML